MDCVEAAFNPSQTTIEDHNFSFLAEQLASTWRATQSRDTFGALKFGSMSHRSQGGASGNPISCHTHTHHLPAVPGGGGADAQLGAALEQHRHVLLRQAGLSRYIYRH